ncbi:hypothetical protein SacmaDRAFT_2031 [Saccharomonospora marina XMU15]|uniref:Uncharacterized protein n=1 Tax=Saccharomonospora marina XMU15 TaxID=882083 RepID=H5X8J1_9PSEU|nr:hypothetical protein SacmaDRAFT_2031 [Saccharomonospora marina XMU15]
MLKRLWLRVLVALVIWIVLVMLMWAVGILN